MGCAWSGAVWTGQSRAPGRKERLHQESGASAKGKQESMNRCSPLIQVRRGEV